MKLKGEQDLLAEKMYETLDTSFHEKDIAFRKYFISNKDEYDDIECLMDRQKRIVCTYYITEAIYGGYFEVSELNILCRKEVQDDIIDILIEESDRINLFNQNDVVKEIKTLLKLKIREEMRNGT